jgi:hypothetical protein
MPPAEANLEGYEYSAGFTVHQLFHFLDAGYKDCLPLSQNDLIVCRPLMTLANLLVDAVDDVPFWARNDTSKVLLPYDPANIWVLANKPDVYDTKFGISTTWT